MKHQKRVFYLTHSERPALVHGFLSLLTLAIPIVSLCLLPVTSFAGNTSGGQMVNSGIVAGYPFGGNVNDSKSLVTTHKRYGQHEYSLNLDDNNKQQALSLYNQAHELENQQQYAEAIPLMKQALQLDPNYDFYFLYTSYLIRCANLYNNANYSYDEALQLATRAVEINPNEGRNYAEATVAAYYAQEFDLVQQYGQKAIAFGSAAIGNANYDLVTQILELVQPYKYTINLDLNPNNPYVQKKDGLLYLAIPTSNLPYQREVKYRLEGAKLVKQTVENGNEVVYLSPQTSPFRVIFEVTKISYSYKKQLSNYNPNASLPADTLEYLKPTDMVDHNSAKVQAIARTLTGKDDLQTVTNILGWLKTNMRYAYEGQLDYKKIDELIDLGAAQCSGYSDIFAALARANGIPTRSVRGPIEVKDNSYPEGYLISHSWNEFYLRNVGWIPVEPQTPSSIGEVYTWYIRIGHYSQSSDSYLSPIFNLELLNGIPSATCGAGAICAAFVKQAVSVPVSQEQPPLGTAQATNATGKPVNTKTVMEGGNSINGQPPVSQVTQKLSDTVDIAGNIIVDPVDIGQPVDTFVYAAATFPGSSVVSYYMLGPGLTILAWNQQPASLVAFSSGILGAVQVVQMYSGTFYYPGTLKVFFGYRLPNGTVITSNSPIDITIDP